MRVLVCGGRTFNDIGVIFRALDSLHRTKPISCVIHGGANGADYCAGRWALHAHISCEEYVADWATQPRAGGVIRNKKMLDEGKPDLVVAFPGTNGTANMVKQSLKANIDVISIGGDGTLTITGRAGEIVLPR